MDQLSIEEVVQGMKQLVLGLSPYLREAGSIEQAEDAILHMEEYDENFHRYEFVRRLHSGIDQALGHVIEELLEQHQIQPQEMATGQETLVSTITDQVINSRQYSEFTKQMQNNICSAAEHLLSNFDAEFGLTESRDSAPHRPKSENLFSDGESSFGESSLNQSAFMLMNTEQFQNIVEALDKKRPIEMRKEALRNLMQASTMDLQNSEVWMSIRRGLVDAMHDTDQELWSLSLQFLSRGFSSNHPAMREMYTTLVEFLQMQFNVSNKGNIPKVKNGLDCRKIENVKLLKAFRLMNEVQQQVPQYWIRYPDRFLDDVLHSTLSLMAIHYTTNVGTPAEMTPLHCLALIDTKATWFVRWMHGHYSRAPLLKMLSRHRNIIEHAVRAVLNFTDTRKVPFDLMSEASEAVSRDSGSSDRQRLCYTGQELEFVYFVHSLCLLSRLLCYRSGQKLFPVKLRDRDEAISVTDLVVSLVHLLTAPVPMLNPRSPSIAYDAGLLVTDVFRKLCATEATCTECICSDAVTSALLAPVSALLDSSEYTVTESTLLQIADIISMIASSTCGRQHLLYGESQEKFSRAKSSPAHILALFARRGLAGDLPRTVRGPIANSVVGSFVYVCRQLYSTCEGLLVLSTYTLHDAIAEAWNQAVRDADMAVTPTPSTDNDGNPSSSVESQYLVLWEDMLRDNLLNFAGTPKGLLLLQQAGAITECVAYMYSRYARRLQVSKCEKFGYGYMMSQVALTAIGMMALRQTGYIEDLILGLWGILEVTDDNPCHTPKTYPVSVIDKAAQKTFINLVILLSSFPAVYEILANQPLPAKEEYSFREYPTTIPGLIDRLVLIDSDAKMHSLFNYEQSHVFGLRLLSCLISCLDTLILLQTQYNFQDVFLKCQEQNVIGSDVIIDMLSVEWNYLLVKAYLIGGPSERILPSRTLNTVGSLQRLSACQPLLAFMGLQEILNMIHPVLLHINGQYRFPTAQEANNTFPFPLFTSYPVPREYIPNIGRSAMKQENDLSKYLADTKKASLNMAWLEKCRKAFCNVLTTKPEQARGGVLQDLLDRCATVLCSSREDAIFPLLEFAGNEGIVKGIKLNRQQEEGIKMTIRYGIHLRVLSSADESTSKLTFLMKQVTYYFQQQQRSVKNSPLMCLQKSVVCYDWFVATIFLLMNGNNEKAWAFLQRLTSLSASAYLWVQRLHASVHLSPSMMQSGIPPVFTSTCHNIDLILHAEVSHIHSAFRMSGYTPAQICHHWLRQCFWNYLDWQEICHYVCTCIVLGVDYQVYICVAILRYRQRAILQHTQQQDLPVFLKEEPIIGFRVGDHMEYMQQLEKKFRSTILPDMLNVSKP